MVNKCRVFPLELPDGLLYSSVPSSSVLKAAAAAAGQSALVSFLSAIVWFMLSLGLGVFRCVVFLVVLLWQALFTF